MPRLAEILQFFCVQGDPAEFYSYRLDLALEGGGRDIHPYTGVSPTQAKGKKAFKGRFKTKPGSAVSWPVETKAVPGPASGPAGHPHKHSRI